MGASPIIRQVYREHIEHFGEPDDSVVYEDHDAPHGRPARIDIFVWRATAEIDITTFATIGMAAAPMSGADHRAELHFSIRCRVDFCDHWQGAWWHVGKDSQRGSDYSGRVSDRPCLRPDRSLDQNRH
jgi:hypothetical protein